MLKLPQQCLVLFRKRNLVLKCPKCSRRICSSPPEESDSNSPLKKTVQDVEKLLSLSSPLADSSDASNPFATTPYAQGTVFSSFSQAKHSLRPKRDPRETSIILFPGQGNQFLGMGQNLLKYPVAEEMFTAASEILGYNLLKLCNDGPIEKLNRTEYCQPAVFVCSLAAVERLKEENPEAINNCIATAGNSLGEISALVFAGCLNFERALKLVKVRAEAMQLCSDMVPSGLLTVLIGADSQIQDAMKDAIKHCSDLGIEDPVCAISNYLYPGAKVIGGHNEALQFIAENSIKYKIKRTSRLPVSGAFHTRLMQPAAEAVAAVLRKTHINEPIISVHKNVDGKRYHNIHTILKTLPRQVYSPVKWEQTMHILYERPPDEDFPLTFECGPGKSLTTLLRKVNAKAAAGARNIYV